MADLPSYRKIELCGYELPEGRQLTAQEERELVRIIQVGNAALDQLVELIVPSLQAAIGSADLSPFDIGDLLGHALAGTRRAVEHHALSGDSDAEFLGIATAMIQGEVADYIDCSDRRRWDCGGDGARWASERLTREVFEDYGTSASMNPQLLTDLRTRATAIEQLVNAHSQLLASMLASRRGRGNDPDLLQRGLLAMRRAAQVFDPERHLRFSSFARTVITNEFEDTRREESGATASGCRLIAQFKKAELQLENRQNSPPSERDVFESLDWSRTKRENYQKAVAVGASQAPVDSEPRRCTSENPLAELIAQEDKSVFDIAWASLGSQAQEILVARYMAEKRETREDLKRRLALSLHQVRRIEEESLENLRGLLGRADEIG